MEGERIAKSLTIYHEKYRGQILKQKSVVDGGDGAGQNGTAGGKEATGEKDEKERKKSGELVKKVRKINPLGSENFYIESN